VNAIKKHLSFANVMASIAVFLALGGSAWAVAKNSVGTKQLKNNAVTTKKIKNNAVTAKKIKDNQITTAKISNGAVTGDKVNLATLGKVPAAATADTATSAGSAGTAGALDGQENVFLKMSGGQTATVAQNGSVSIVAECIKDDDGGDYIYLYGQTTQDGAVMSGDSDFNGGDSPAAFLNVGTAKDDRFFVSAGKSTGVTGVDADIDSGFVLGPDGKMITVNSEGLALGLNYLGADCIVAGVFNKLSSQ